MMTPEKVKKFVAQFHSTEELSRGCKGALIGALEKAAGGSEGRHLVLGYLFGDGKPLSSKELTPSQWVGLREWIGMQSVGDVWIPRKEFADEVKSVLSAKSEKRIYVFDD